MATTMYLNKRKVGEKSIRPSQPNDDKKAMYSALGILDSNYPRADMSQNAEDFSFAGHKNKQIIPSATGSVLDGGHVNGGSNSARGIESDTKSNEADSGFREHDNMSQNSNDSESYMEMNVVKTGSFENHARSLPTAEDIQSQLVMAQGSSEEAFKEELLRLFEVYFKTKMEERMHGFRSRQMEWEEASKTEKERLGSKLAKEKVEMQRQFADAISKLTHSFSEERNHIEQCYEDQVKHLKDKLSLEQKRVDGKFEKERVELKEKLEAEYQVMLTKEVMYEKQEGLRERSEMKARFNKEKFELEKNFNQQLTEAETSLQKVRSELKESMRMEKESQERAVEVEMKLKEERQQRLEVESELEQVKEKYSNIEAQNEKENEQLRGKIDVLREEIKGKNIEIKRLQEANQESNTKIRALTRHLQKRVKRNSEVSVKSQESAEGKDSEDRSSANTAQSSAWNQQGSARALASPTLETDKMIKVYDSKLRLTPDERKRILVYVTFEKQPDQGVYRILNAILPKQPVSSTVRVLMTSDDGKEEEVSSEQ